MSRQGTTSDLEAAACVCGAREQANPNPCCKDALRKAMAAIRSLRHEPNDVENLGARVLEILAHPPGKNASSTVTSIRAAARALGLL